MAKHPTDGQCVSDDELAQERAALTDAERAELDALPGAHAPECSGGVYGCFKCGQNGMTIDESFAHAETCKGDLDYNCLRDADFRMQHGLKIEFPVINRHGDLKCPACGNDDIAVWADDGEADLGDWWDCQTSMGGCGAEGALVRAKDIFKTQNGCEVKYA